VFHFSIVLKLKNSRKVTQTIKAAPVRALAHLRPNAGRQSSTTTTSVTTGRSTPDHHFHYFVKKEEVERERRVSFFTSPISFCFTTCSY
jgi:hypothetical protein